MEERLEGIFRGSRLTWTRTHSYQSTFPIIQPFQGHDRGMNGLVTCEELYDCTRWHTNAHEVIPVRLHTRCLILPDLL
jgi:hypothetical protein